MKKLLTIALVLASVNAMATRARNTALQYSPHIPDFYSPENLGLNADSLTIEVGTTGLAPALVAPATFTTGDVTNLSTTSDASKLAEGTLIKSFDFGIVGITLGHQEGLVYKMRKAAAVAGVNATTLLNNIDAQQNPIQLGYAMKLSDMNVGFGLVYSKYEDKTAAAEKESSIGVKAGVSAGAFFVNGLVMVDDKYENAGASYKGKPSFSINGGWHFTADTSLLANVTSSGYKTAAAGTDTLDVENMSATVKVVDTVKADAMSFFYGAGLTWSSGKEKVADATNEGLSLPVILGIEAGATSWLTLRGSVSQDVLISKAKDSVAGTDFDPAANNTQFAAGLGLNFSKVVADLALVKNTNTNTDDGFAKLGLTYKF